ncbi:MAG: glycosyltransferase [Desulfovibrionaceae bacterium]
MRILNLDAPFLVAAFRAAGHSVLSIGIAKHCDHCITHPVHAFHVYQQVCAQGFVPDAVFCCDSGNLPYFPAIESLPCPLAYYSIDTYYNPWHFSIAYAYDHIFVAQREHVPLFTSQNLSAEWLPLFAPADTVSVRESVRDIPVTFVGTLAPKNIPERKPFLDAFRRIHPLFVTSGDYVNIFHRAQIVLNQTAASELNFRCFEAMACGAALLMEHSPHGLEELFTPGEQLLPLYPRGNACEAAAIARAALQQPLTLAKIARQGQECVSLYHTDTHRAQYVVTVLENMVRQQLQNRRMAELPLRRQHLCAAYAMLFDELNTPALLQHKQFFLDLATTYTPSTLLPTDTATSCKI